jgi:hypothetical protein
MFPQGEEYVELKRIKLNTSVAATPLRQPQQQQQQQ